MNREQLENTIKNKFPELQVKFSSYEYGRQIEIWNTVTGELLYYASSETENFDELAAHASDGFWNSKP